MTLLELYKKVKNINDSLNSADVPLKCNCNDFNVDFEINSKDAIVSHIEVKQDLALTWEDIATLIRMCEQVKTEWWFRDIKGIGTQKHFEEVLRRFNAKRNETSKQGTGVATDIKREE